MNRCQYCNNPTDNATFCSRKCAGLGNIPRKPAVQQMINCYKCGKVTTNPKFCSRSCAASFNNRIPKRTSDRRRCECGKLINNKTQFCGTCRKDWYETKTIDELCLAKNLKHPWSLYNSVRSHARSKMQRAAIMPICGACGYSAHVQVCHIKPIAAFASTATLSEVNDLNNLVYLCPNHHWELDHGLQVDVRALHQPG